MDYCVSIFCWSLYCLSYFGKRLLITPFGILRLFLYNVHLYFSFQHSFYTTIVSQWKLENTDGAIKNGKSRETRNILYTRRRKTKTQHRNLHDHKIYKSSSTYWFFLKKYKTLGQIYMYFLKNLKFHIFLICSSYRKTYNTVRRANCSPFPTYSYGYYQHRIRNKHKRKNIHTCLDWANPNVTIRF